MVRPLLAAALALLPAAAPAAAEDPLCGLYCLHVTLAGFEKGVTREALEAELGPPPPSGYSLGRLSAAAADRGLSVLPVETTWGNLRRRSDAGERFACLARLDGPAPTAGAADGSGGGPPTGGGAGGDGVGHFVLLAGFEGDRVVRVVDPPRSYELETRTMEELWDGSALLIADGPLAPEEAYVAGPLGPWAWAGLGLAAAAVAGLAVVLVRRRTAAAAVALIGLTAAAGCDWGDDPAGAPRAVFSATHRDLGLVAVDPAGYEATFPLANRGAAPLKVLQLVSGCGCTSAAVDRSVLAPGESTKVRLTVTPEQEERRQVTVVAVTDDPRTPRVPLKVRCDAVAPRRFEPARLDFGDARVRVDLPDRPDGDGGARSGRLRLTLDGNAGELTLPVVLPPAEL